MGVSLAVMRRQLRAPSEWWLNCSEQWSHWQVFRMCTEAWMFRADSVLNAATQCAFLQVCRPCEYSTCRFSAARVLSTCVLQMRHWNMSTGAEDLWVLRTTWVKLKAISNRRGTGALAFCLYVAWEQKIAPGLRTDIRTLSMGMVQLIQFICGLECAVKIWPGSLLLTDVCSTGFAVALKTCPGSFTLIDVRSTGTVHCVQFGTGWLVKMRPGYKVDFGCFSLWNTLPGCTTDHGSHSTSTEVVRHNVGNTSYRGKRLTVLYICVKLQ